MTGRARRPRGRPSWSRFIRTQGFSGSGLAAIVAGVVFAAVVITAVGVGLPLVLAEYTALIVFVGVPILVVIFVMSIAFAVRSTHRGAGVQAWAEKSGMRYVHQRRSRDSAPWRGTPFPRTGGYAVRHHAIGSDVETARFRSLPDDSGYHSAGLVNSFTFVRFTLPTSVPHLVVTSNRSSTLNAAGLAISGGRVLRGSIEFDASFTLHCPADYERDALYIFTPDVLALLIDVAPGCDLELVDDTAYLYMSREPKLWDERVGADLLAVVELLRRKLDRQTRHYVDERSSAGTSRAGSPTVARSGLRLANRRSARGVLLATALWIPGIAVAVAIIAQALGWVSVL
ncbi:hypothetical protein [Agreia sp. VKM Ac-1783]|uniref:hypothetical protein n=1 Tax=Agreia sp. VKM Ac-1783 TaxID=1938889 RepID=UPI000A2AEEE2|nr:hypothetical protein [Agreia sp. VKM Ac-1783]SMQ68475.1 hypothetical protein SAMN06295943_1880 [Agreia sp. VKM Ac-1783]